MDKHVLANVCVVVEVFPPTREWVILVEFWVSTLYTAFRILNIDRGPGTIPGVMSSMSSAGASIPAAAGGMPSAAAAMRMIKSW